MSTINIIASTAINKIVRIYADGIFLLGDLHIPEESHSIVILAYCGGRTRNHPRCLQAARVLRDKGIGTMLCDLMNEEEEVEDETTNQYQDEADLLARRLIEVTNWVANEPETLGMRIGYLGACTGGAAAIIAAAKLSGKIGAVVTREGRMDLAAQALRDVECPTLLIVGEDDAAGIKLNCEAMKNLSCVKELKVIHGASHLFGEPGKLQEIAELSGDWFRRHLDAKEISETHFK